jgi:hypothetical protein
LVSSASISRSSANESAIRENATRPGPHFVATFCVFFLLAVEAKAGDVDAVARQLANPLANLTSVPFEFDFERGGGLNGDNERLLLSIEPVIPISINDNWALISRTIVPVLEKMDSVSGRRQTGIGDTQESLFLSPKTESANGWVWGAGLVLQLPTASNDLLGSSKWGAGPTAAALRQTESDWTYGALVNHVVSLRGNDPRKVNATLVESLIALRVGRGRTVSLDTESTYDWNAHAWTVPLNLAISQVVPIGGQLCSFQVGVTWYAAARAMEPNWGLSTTITLLFTHH